MRIALTYQGGGTVQIVGVTDAGLVDSLPSGARFVGWGADARALKYAIHRGGRRELREHLLGTTYAADRLLAVSGVGGAPTWRDGDVLGWHAQRIGARAVLIVTREEEVVSIHVASASGSGIHARRWRQRADARDSVAEVVWFDDRLVFLGRTGLVLAAVASDRRDTVRLSRGRSLLAIASARDGVYLLDGTGGEASLMRLASDGRTLDPVTLPVSGSGRALFTSGDHDGVVLPIDRWLGDGGWYLVAPQRAARLALTREVPADDRYLAERRLICAADGTQVPMTMIRRRVATPGRPVLMRVFADEGHVLRPAAQVAHIIDMLSFAYWQTGEPTFQPVGR